jgi:anaphase-promoting complex subunit 4
MGLENNKAAHHIEVCPNSDTKITQIGWARSNIPSQSLQLGSSQLASEFAKEWDDKDRSLPNLPQELMFLEIETALPKISPLPSGSAGSG